MKTLHLSRRATGAVIFLITINFLAAQNTVTPANGSPSKTSSAPLPTIPPPTLPPATYGVPKGPVVRTERKPEQPVQTELPKGVIVDRTKTPPPEVVDKAKKAAPMKPTRVVKDATLGLPRLDTAATAAGVAKVAPQKFELDTLQATAGAPGVRKAEQSGVNYLALDPAVEWSRPLRGNPQDVTFVSLNVHASMATVIEAGGAWISVLESDKPGRAALMVGEPGKAGALAWRKVGTESPKETFGGKEMAALPILTMRLDPANGTWDLYSGFRLVATGLPLVPDAKKGNARQLTVRAGSAGAWLNAVAVSDENPLFPDANANGIDDAFETTKKGAPLAVSASAAERKALAAEWQTSQRTRPVPPAAALRPLPDRLVAQMEAAKPR